jgi:hypothetical protein
MTVCCWSLLLHRSPLHMTLSTTQNKATSIRSIITDAFSQPFSSISNMIRITFIVGGGKLSRQKYDEKAMQAVTSTLKQLEYEEDRGASCILECGGCYKIQHDTGKNVFTVVVFPRVVGSVKQGPKQGENRKEAEDDVPLLPKDSPGYKMAVCILAPTFQNLLSTHCPTYTEKKECLKCLAGLLELEQALEHKMIGGHALDAGEQSFYDESSELKEKYEFTQQEANRHIEDGRLTPEERRLLVEMNQKRIETLMADQNSALVAKKLKKALVRKEQLQSLSNEVNSLTQLPPLRNESRIFTLRKKLLSLQAIEDSSRGRLLTLDETRALTEKFDIENETERLEMSSRGWFEEDKAFHNRLLTSRQRCRATKTSGVKSTGPAPPAGGRIVNAKNAVNKWILPGERPSKEAIKNKLKGKGGAVFTAMMMDSSSDEEEEHEVANVAKLSLEPKNCDSSATSATNTKAAHDVAKGTNSISQSADTELKSQTQSQDKKKKKKAKGKQNKKEKIQDSEAIESTIETTKSSSLVSSSLLEFCQTIILPVIISILSVVESLVMSMFQKKKPNKK